MIKDLVPAERLLVLSLDGKGFGWDEICAFVGLEVPEAAYPRGFALEEFQEALDRRLNPQYRKLRYACGGVFIAALTFACGYLL